MAQTCIGFQGQALLGGDSPWWRRIFRKKLWRHWRIWCLRQNSVYVLALYLQSGKLDHEAETVAGMIVNSIEFNDLPACTPEIFSRRVLELARSKFPLLECQPAPDFQIRLGESKINLVNFYRSYLNSPEQFESNRAPRSGHCRAGSGMGKSQSEPELEGSPIADHAHALSGRRLARAPAEHGRHALGRGIGGTVRHRRIAGLLVHPRRFNRSLEHFARRIARYRTRKPESLFRRSTDGVHGGRRRTGTAAPGARSAGRLQHVATVERKLSRKTAWRAGM